MKLMDGQNSLILLGLGGALLCGLAIGGFNYLLIRLLGRVDKMGSQDVLNVIQAGICDGDRLGTRFDVR